MLPGGRYFYHIAHLLFSLDYRPPILMAGFGGRHNYLVTVFRRIVSYCSIFEPRSYF